ncbi:MAG: hypothetical protein RL196_304 [Actinomycetota bacterium]|jgi:type I restriction enzyme S subunit
MSFERVKVGAIANFYNNARKPVTKKDRKAGTIPYYGAAGIQDYVAEFIFDGHYVLVGEDGTVLQPEGKPTLQNVKGKSWVNNHAHVLAGEDSDDTDFLFYALGIEDITAFVTGAVQMKLNMGNLKEVEIFWPSEQRMRRSIVRLLRDLDHKIAVNNATAANLEQIAQTIFKSWFIDFDPVYAKARGEMPDGMDGAIANLFPSSLAEDEGQLVPLGWGIQHADSLFKISIGRTPPRKEPEWFCQGDAGVPWMSIRDMGTYGVYGTKTSEGLTKEAISKIRVPVVPENTVVMSFKLTVGKVCITDVATATNEAIAHFGDRSGISPGPAFTYLWLKNLDLSSLDSTSSIATATNSAQIKQIMFLCPSREILTQFEGLISPLFAQIRNLTQQNQTLASIRDGLLPRLISGELEIPEELLGE